MSLMIDLTPAEEARLEAAARQTGLDPAALVKKLVAENLPKLIGRNGEGLNETARATEGINRNHFYFTATREEFNRALDEIAEMNRDLPVLPPEAFERESIYEDY